MFDIYVQYPIIYIIILYIWLIKNNRRYLIFIFIQIYWMGGVLEVLFLYNRLRFARFGSGAKNSGHSYPAIIFLFLAAAWFFLVFVRLLCSLWAACCFWEWYFLNCVSDWNIFLRVSSLAEFSKAKNPAQFKVLRRTVQFKVLRTASKNCTKTVTLPN